MNNKEFEVMDVELPVEIGVKDSEDGALDSENGASDYETQKVLDNVLCDD